MKYRGIYHAHSRYSGDGKYTLSEIRNLCLKQGISFIIMTEHAEDMTPESLRSYVSECRRMTDREFLCIPGLEVPYVGKVHVGCFPVESTPSVPLYADGIRSLRDSGSYTILHHPSKENYYIDDALPTLIDGVEVWNSRYEGKVAPSTRTINFVDTEYSGRPLFGGLDLHSGSQFGGPLLVVKVGEFTEHNVVTAIREQSVVIEGRVFRLHAKGFTPMKRIERRLLRALYRVLRKARSLIS